MKKCLQEVSHRKAMFVKILNLTKLQVTLDSLNSLNLRPLENI